MTNQVEELYKLGWTYFDQNNYAEAETTLKQVLELDENHIDSNYYLSRVYQQLKKYAEAERYFSLALSIIGKNPKDSLLNHWGELLVKKGEYQKALSLFSRAIQDMPWVPAYHWNIALTYEYLEQCQEARGHWERYLTLEKDKGERQIVIAHLKEEHDSPQGRCGSTSS